MSSATLFLHAGGLIKGLAKRDAGAEQLAADRPDRLPQYSSGL
jgi:hypothetical protein